MSKKIVYLLLILVTFLSFGFTSTSKASLNAEGLNLDAKAYILVDYNTGSVLLKENETEHLEVASMVKLMTSLITIEKLQAGELSLDQKVLVSEYAASQEGSQAFLDANKEYTINDLLKSVIIASANDSSVVLAEAIAGTEENFVKLMNEKAKELGLKNTLYANATGLPSEKEQYSCAEDIAKLLKEEINHELYFNYSKIWIDEIIHESGRRTELVNTNILTRQYKGCDIGKTGFTDEAGYCLSASCLKNNMRLISVVIGAKSSKERFSITTNILNYGFNNYESKMLASAKEELSEDIKIKGRKEPVCAVFEKDVFILSKKGNSGEIKTKIELLDNLKLPLNSGEKLGVCYFVKDGVVIAEVNIVSKEEIKKPSFKESLKRVLDNFNI